jgi:hypothetical protein
MTTEQESVLAFDEVNDKYNGEWLLLRVTKTERDKILEGSVVAHDTDREKIAALLPRAQEQQPRPSLAFFRAKSLST